MSAFERLVAILCPYGEQRHDKHIEGVASDRNLRTAAFVAMENVCMFAWKAITPRSHKPYSTGGHLGSILAPPT